jgi:hypothetical protein
MTILFLAPSYLFAPRPIYFLSASFICELVIDDPLGVQLFDEGNHIGANFP